MGLKNFSIFFDKSDSIYYVGETVTGRVDITTDTPKKIRGIIIRIKGEARVSWHTTEQQTNSEGKTETQRVELSGEEEYYKMEYSLLGGQSSTAFELPAGNHKYPFTFILPPDLPCSFEGERGSIRYTVKVIIDRPWKFDHETKSAITVLKPLDLNTTPHLKEPGQLIFEKYFCCCWCKSGPLTSVVKIPKRGFVSGETIPIVIDIDNNSNINVPNVKVDLLKVITYVSQFPRKESVKDREIIQTISVGPVSAGISANYSPIIKVPPLPPSNLMNCNIIDLDYQLQITLNVEGCHTNEDGFIPITIGTYPMRPENPPPYAPQGYTPAYPTPSAPSAPDFLGSNEVHYGWGAPPPAYQAYGFSPSNLQDKDDNEYTRYNNEPFYPMYPVFNFNNNEKAT